MTETVENNEQTPDELTLLKQRADQLGVKYHTNIGVDALRKRVNEVIEPSETEEGGDSEGETEDGEANVVNITKAQGRAKLKREANRLVRVRVTNMNPNKKEWEGEMLTVSNSVVGTIKKYVPFDVEWHVPVFILNMLRQRQCQTFINVKNRDGTKTKKGKLIKEFAIETLEPLTEKEIKELAQRQAMANGTAEA